MKNLFFKSALFFILAVIAHTTAYSQTSINQHSIKFASFNTQYATLVGEDGVIMNTMDGGATWTTQNSGITSVLYGNAIIDSVTAIAVGENGIILKSTDSGNTWNIVKSGTTVTLKSVVMSGQSIIVCGDNGTILKSDDLGGSWSTQNITSNLLNSILVVNGAMFIAGDNGTLLTSSDGGSTWKAMVPFHGTQFHNFKAIGGSDANNITVIGDNFFVSNSHDGGITWNTSIIPSYTTIPNNLKDVHFFSSSNGVIVGEKIILKTTDGGDSWFDVTVQDLNVTLFSVAFSDFNNGITVGQNGQQLFTADGGTTWTAGLTAKRNMSALKNSVRDNKITLNQNYPNPFNPSTVISFNLPFSGVVSLKVYDMVGKEVKTLANGIQSAGNYSYRFDASNLSSGIYFYVLKATSGSNNFSKTMRMILTK